MNNIQTLYIYKIITYYKIELLKIHNTAASIYLKTLTIHETIVKNIRGANVQLYHFLRLLSIGNFHKIQKLIFPFIVHFVQ